MKKVGLWLMGRRKAIFNFLPFLFTQISKDYFQKSYNGFWGFLVISTTSQIFLICKIEYYYDQLLRNCNIKKKHEMKNTSYGNSTQLLTYKRKWNGGPFNFFSICTDIHFGSLFFPNERNMAISLLMIHLKCTVVHYTNLNWSFKNKSSLSYGSLNILFRFFFRFFI